MSDFEKVMLEFASSEHAKIGQLYDDKPYSYHLKQVADVLAWGHIEVGLVPDSSLYAAAVCHDLLEDTNLSYNDLVKEIGPHSADIVYDVTNELGRNRKERAEKTYPKIRENPRAIMVKLADRIANVEYSQKRGSSMYEKYKKEYLEFDKALYSPSFFKEYPAMGPLWGRLDRAVYGKFFVYSNSTA